MAVKMFNLPDPGEGLVEAEVVSWKVKAGDTVAVNDVVIEIETAKSLVELPIPWAGSVVELLVAEGDTVEVGAPIVSIDVVGADREDPGASAPGAGGDSVPTGPGSVDEAGGERVANLVGYGPSAGSTTRRARRGATPAVEPAAPVETAPPVEPAASMEPTPPVEPVETVTRPMASPPVRKFAKDHGIDLARVRPTRADGVITRADCEAHLAAAAPDSAPAEQEAAPTPGLAPAPGQRETRTPIKGVRKTTAAAMVGSAFTAPHVTEFITVDVTRTVELVERLKQDRDLRELRLTPLVLLARALCVAVRRNPGINATWDEQAQEIVVKHYVNLGIAASTPRGLMVPNIKDADQMDVAQLAQALGELVSTAREGRTAPADMAGGTITITNVGVFGVDNGTPILNPGEAAILCFGAIRSMPWVVTGDDGREEIVPRKVTQLSLSFDHRLVDGDLGSRFLADIAALLEDPALALVWGA